MKTDGRLGRNYLLGVEGDRINAILCGAGHNIRKLLRACVYQNKCVNGIFKKLKNNLVAEPVGPVKNGFLFFTSP